MTLEIQSYRDLDAWLAGMDLVAAAYALARMLPASERFELGRQIRKAAVSVPAHVAEGQAGGGRRYVHHVRIALGSLAELDTEIEAAIRLSLLNATEAAGTADQIARVGDCSTASQGSWIPVDAGAWSQERGGRGARSDIMNIPPCTSSTG